MNLMEIEEKRIEVEAKFEMAAPRLAELRGELADLETERIQALVDTELGIATNGKVAQLDKRKAEIEGKMVELEQIVETFHAMKAELNRHEKLLQMHAALIELPELIEQANDDVERYERLRLELFEFTQAHNSRRRRIGQLMQAVHDVSTALAVDVSDELAGLPNRQRITYHLDRFRIDPELLAGEKNWHGWPKEGKRK